MLAMNNILDIAKKIHSCTGCQMCSAICPSDSIDIKLNDKGFYEPFVDSMKCISCGKCKKVCYKYDNKIIKSDENKNVWSFSGNDDLLKEVTSGGAAHLLAEQALKNDYKVIGVVYDTEKDIAIAKIGENFCELEQFKGSKYIQAYTEEIYKILLNSNSDERYVIFGTPCQIYAVNKALTQNGRRNNVILVDLFCHGVPSYFLWKKTIDDVKDKLKVRKFEKVTFRSKKLGWHDFCLHFETSDKEITRNEFSCFYKMFFDNIVLNDSCYDCKLRSTLYYTDIRLGDFWGHEYDDNIKGVSAVVAVTDAGMNFISKLPGSFFIKKHILNDVISAQSYDVIYKIDTDLREKAFKLLKSDKDVDCILSRYTCLLSKKKRAALIVKKIIYKLPFRYRCAFKKIYHKLSK